MKEFVKAVKVGELKPGEMKMVEVGEEQILLANVGGQFYAVTDVCTHAEGSLSEGLLEGVEVECPLHGSRFNVTNGEVVDGPAEEALERYAVRVQEGDILVGPA